MTQDIKETVAELERIYGNAVKGNRASAIMFSAVIQEKWPSILSELKRLWGDEPREVLCFYCRFPMEHLRSATIYVLVCINPNHPWGFGSDFQTALKDLRREEKNTGR